MNNNIGIAMCGLSTSCKDVSDRLGEVGTSVTVVETHSFPMREDIITYSYPPRLDPTPFFEETPVGKMRERDPVHYANNIAKRRKKNKNKKTHRK